MWQLPLSLPFLSSSSSRRRIQPGYVLELARDVLDKMLAPNFLSHAGAPGRLFLPAAKDRAFPCTKTMPLADLEDGGNFQLVTFAELDILITFAEKALAQVLLLLHSARERAPGQRA
jgi:hypothetical protein